MEEDCVSMRNEPLDPLETIEDMEFNFMDDFSDNNGGPANNQSDVSHVREEPIVKRKGGYFKEVDEYDETQLSHTKEIGGTSFTSSAVLQELIPDNVSMSSTSSRASSFRKAGFAALIKDEQDEEQLETFFGSERHYLILTIQLSIV